MAALTEHFLAFVSVRQSHCYFNVVFAVLFPFKPVPLNSGFRAGENEVYMQLSLRSLGHGEECGLDSKG